ncbi:hypothetical protein E4T56_gene17268, partial [Termitomyces sp. T112]
MVEAVVRVLGEPAVRVASLPWRLLKIASFFAVTPRELMEMRYLWQQPVRLDNSRLIAALGAEPHTALDHAVHTTLASMGCLAEFCRPMTSPMTGDVLDETRPQTHAFEADVAKLLHMMVHSVYSDKDVFLRELISNAADACEKLRYEAIARPDLLGDDPSPRITITIDADNNRLTLE